MQIDCVNSVAMRNHPQKWKQLSDKRMESNRVILKYQEAIVAIYREQNLTCLPGLDQSYQLNGRNILEWHLNVVGKAAQRNRQFQYNRNMDDIFFCSTELLFFTANLYLYRPHINSPLRDAFPVGGRNVYPNYQNLGSNRYHMFADVASQAACNYWDRIGDLIGSYFPERIEPDKVFFSTAIDIVLDQFRGSEHFTWLKRFKETDYRELNKKRKQVVHYNTLDTEFKYDHVKSVEDREAIEALQAEREALADFYKQHISLTLAGYEKTLLFLEEISPELFRDVA
jgi:hypothetical protein